MNGFIYHKVLIQKKWPGVHWLLAPKAGFTFMSMWWRLYEPVFKCDGFLLFKVGDMGKAEIQIQRPWNLPSGLAI